MAQPLPPWSGQATWHVARWGAWGWAETVVKLFAIVIAAASAVGEGAWSISTSHRITYWCLTAVAGVYLVAVVDRWIDREIVAMAFVLAIIMGHWSMVYAMGRDDWPAGLVQTFAGLMFFGDLVKIGYFVRTGPRVRKLPRRAPVAMTGILASVYLVAFLAA